MPHSSDGNLFKQFKAPQPAMNALASFSGTPTIDGGQNGAQLWFGRNSHVIYGEKIKTTGEYLRTL